MFWLRCARSWSQDIVTGKVQDCKSELPFLSLGIPLSGSPCNHYQIVYKAGQVKIQHYIPISSTLKGLILHCKSLMVPAGSFSTDEDTRSYSADDQVGEQQRVAESSSAAYCRTISNSHQIFVTFVRQAGRLYGSMAPTLLCHHGDSLVSSFLLTKVNTQHQTDSQ